MQRNFLPQNNRVNKRDMKKWEGKNVIVRATANTLGLLGKCTSAINDFSLLESCVYT